MSLTDSDSLEKWLLRAKRYDSKEEACHLLNELLSSLASGDVVLLPRLADKYHIAKYIGCKPDTIYRWVKARFIPHLPIGGKLRFDIDDVKGWLQTLKVPGRKTRTPKIRIHQPGGRRRSA